MSHWDRVLQVRELAGRNLPAVEISKRLHITVEAVLQLQAHTGTRLTPVL